MGAVEGVLGEIVKYLILIFLLLFGLSFALKTMGIDPKTLGRFAPLIEAAGVLTGSAWVYEKMKKSGLVDDVKNAMSGGKEAEEAAKGAKEAEEAAKGAKEADEAAKVAKEAEEFSHLI